MNETIENLKDLLDHYLEEANCLEGQVKDKKLEIMEELDGTLDEIFSEIRELRKKTEDLI
jgi:hypothetical protein